MPINWEKMGVTVIVSALLLTTGCKGESTVTEYPDDADVVANLNGNSLTDILLSAGLVIDSNEVRSSARKAWFTQNSINRDRLSSRGETAAKVGCQLTVQEQQKPKILVLSEETAYPMPQGKIISCKDGKISWALQDPDLQVAVESLGLDPEELEQIQFFRLPLDTANSFSFLAPDGTASVVFYEGLMKSFSGNSLDADSTLRGALLHEVGIVQQLRKDNQRHIRTVYEKARVTCLQKIGLDNLPEEEKIAQCRKNISLGSKSIIYGADEFATKVLARKKYRTGFRPTEFAKYIRMKSSAGRDSSDPHPDATERAIKFEVGLKNAGIDLTTGGILTQSAEQQ